MVCVVSSAYVERGGRDEVGFHEVCLRRGCRVGMKGVSGQVGRGDLLKDVDKVFVVGVCLLEGKVEDGVEFRDVHGGEQKVGWPVRVGDPLEVDVAHHCPEGGLDGVGGDEHGRGVCVCVVKDNR